jgi:hypothetical protein
MNSNDNTQNRSQQANGFEASEEHREVGMTEKRRRHTSNCVLLDRVSGFSQTVAKPNRSR